MNLKVMDKVLKGEHESTQSLDDKIIFYFNKFWDEYEKIVVLSSLNIKEYAILVNGVYCDIPKIFKENNKIICYIVGIDKNKNKIKTNKVVIDRR